ncbi:hypothetical protein NQ314_000504 [Rhamnusium bicolor]|uniref:Uncharacterized protein n=1 Tax=Rhamnusium bicolor TaxID=1586634 RepID=A0AAV8ZY34_9CUCU|nr:hypothetical protein NQ314_000504 [Rhamnusium bicolor]
MVIGFITFNALLVLLLTILILAYYFIIYSCRIFYEMEPEDAKYMRTERKPGSIDVHPNIDAIVLNYEIDVQILGPKENAIHGEKRCYL